MSIESIGNQATTWGVGAIKSSAALGTEKSEEQTINKIQENENKAVSNDKVSKIQQEFTSLSTQDFVSLRQQFSQGSFEILDEVISDMKEDTENVGKAIEAISELIKKTSKDHIGLMVLEKTLEALKENEPK